MSNYRGLVVRVHIEFGFPMITKTLVKVKYVPKIHVILNIFKISEKKKQNYIAKQSKRNRK